MVKPWNLDLGIKIIIHVKEATPSRRTPLEEMLNDSRPPFTFNQIYLHELLAVFILTPELREGERWAQK